MSYEVCKACRDKMKWTAYEVMVNTGAWYCPHELDFDLIHETDEDPPPGCIHKLEQAVAAGLREGEVNEEP